MSVNRVLIDSLLTEMGFTHRRARTAARQALETAGIAARSEAKMPAGEMERSRQLLRDRFALVCQQCARRGLSVSGKQAVRAMSPADCHVCAGSDNRRAAASALQAIHAAGWQRLVVVGGAPNTRHELQELLGDEVQLRLVDGTLRRTQASADDDLAWADLVVIWGSTQLDHKVSNLYTGRRGGRAIMVAKRGVAALLDAIAQAATGEGSAR
jgi:hypothetical protein